MSNDRSYLASLQDYYARHRALPSYASIGSLLGLKSKSSVAAMVARLKLAGYLESTPDRRLAPTGRFFARALAESPVQAGQPNPVEDGHSDALTIDDYLIERPSQTVLIRVKGDSMQDAGILEGDLVVVEKTAAARRGDIVVAIVDGQFTLKRLDVDRGQFKAEAREQGLSRHPSRGHARDLRRDGRARAQDLGSPARASPRLRARAGRDQRRSTSTRQS
jgi:repressor LexA